MELVQVNNNQIMIADEICQKMVALNKVRKQAEELESQIKTQLMWAMKDCSIKSVDNEFFKATLVEPKPRKTLDTKALQVIYPEIYEEFLKESETSPSLRMTYKERIEL